MMDQKEKVSELDEIRFTTFLEVQTFLGSDSFIYSFHWDFPKTQTKRNDDQNSVTEKEENSQNDDGLKLIQERKECEWKRGREK